MGRSLIVLSLIIVVGEIIEFAIEVIISGDDGT